MQLERGAMTNQDDPARFGDTLRRQAATWGHAAEVQARLARQMRDSAAAHDGPADLADLAELADTDADRARLMQWLAAAQALAHDELIARGGRDNADALAEYRQTTKRNLSLMPKEFGKPEPDR
jgi:hypothetical protein